MDFRRPENRELWLTAYRYIGSLGQRGTWRTAFEWAKLLLSLDPEGDPYCMHLIMDQLAIRGGQYQQFIDLMTEEDTGILDNIKFLPNTMTSLGLAYHKLKRPKEARKALSRAMEWFPWVFPLLFKELDIEHIPQSIWGREPRNNYEKLQATSYVVRAKDIWNVPEALSFLVEIAETSELGSPLREKRDASVSQEEARHYLLSENPTLINLVPRDWTTSGLSASDPLPPYDDLPSYDMYDPDEEDDSEDGADPREATGRNPGRLQSLLGNFMRRVLSQMQTGDSDGEPSGGMSEQDVARVEQILEALEESELNTENPVAGDANFQAAQDVLDAIIRRTETITQPQDVPGDAQAPSPTGPNYEGPSEGDIQMAESLHEQASSSAQSAEPAPYDDQANQRWLAGRGMLRLKDFIADHGSDESAWKADDVVDRTPVTEYVERIKRLERRSSREFILNYALKQGAGAEATDLIRRML